MTSEKWVGIHTGGAHYLDHLGVLCEGLGIPLIVTEQKTYQAAQKFYPQLHVEYRDLSELTLDFLADRADVIFESGHHFALQLIPLWELIHGKKMRVVYCPHGHSDKKHQTRKDISLIYGNHMYLHLQKLGEIDRLEKTVVTGNYRQVYYQTHQSWYNHQLEILLQNQIDPIRKTIFYAPSWSDIHGQNRSLWMKQAMRVLQEVAAHFNVLLRLHPFLHDLYPAELEQFYDRSQKIKRVVDLSTFPAIYPILDRVDYYLGDFSSIGYDFLALDKPLFFLNHPEGEIAQCGIILKEEDHWGEAINRFQDHASLSLKRKALYSQVFGKKRSFDAIKKDLKKALQYDRASWLTALK